MSLAHSAEDTLFAEGREAIAANIRALMGRKRVTQTRLAAAMDKSQAYISRRLSGEVPLDTDELLFLARYFEVDVVELLAGTRSRCSTPFTVVSDLGQMELPYGDPPFLTLVGE